MELIEQLTSGLGIDESQAQGGAGMIFNLVKSKLGGDDFGQIANAIPGLDGLMQAAPAAAGGGIMGKVMGMLGGKAGAAAGIAGLAAGFSKLGLDAGMVGKFVPIVLSFVEQKGGAGMKDMLQKVLA